jgi:hypothetical protein
MDIKLEAHDAMTKHVLLQMRNLLSHHLATLTRVCVPACRWTDAAVFSMGRRK